MQRMNESKDIEADKVLVQFALIASNKPMNETLEKKWKLH